MSENLFCQKLNMMAYGQHYISSDINT